MEFRQKISTALSLHAFTRDIWLICLSLVIGAFGEGLYFWVFPLYIKTLQADYVQIGLVFSALYGVSALAPLPGGLLADRFDRKKILILAWIPWVFAPLIYSFSTTWTQLIPGTVCWGISMIGVPAFSAYIITAIRDKTKLAFVLSFVSSSYSFSYIFAPSVGAYLATIVGMRLVLQISALLTGISTCVFIFLHSQHPNRAKDEEKKAESQTSPVEPKRLWRKILVWSAFFTAASFFVTIGRTFVPTYLSEQVKLNEFYVGIFGTVNYAGITFVGITMGRLGDRWRKSGAIAICLLLYAVSMIPLLLIHETTILLLIAFALGGSAVTGTLVSSYVGTIAPENRRGLWVSIPQTLSLAAAFAAPYFAGYLYTLNPSYVFIFSLVAMPFLVLFALLKLKE